MKNKSTTELLEQIKEYKTYATKNHGRVKILKKNSDLWGSAGTVFDKKECLRVKTETATLWVPISEIIIPENKKPLSGAARKRRFDEKQKSLSKKKVSLDLDQDAYLLISTIQKGVEKRGSKKNLSEIVSDLLMLVSDKKAIKDIVEFLVK